MIKLLLLFRVAWGALFAGSARVFYDRIANIYDRIFIDHVIHAENIVILLTSIYPDKEKCLVLDLGSGTGLLSKALSRQGFRVIGIDISLESLRVFKRTDQWADLIQGEAESLPISDNYFQALVCLGVWRHLKRLEVVLNEICRVLSKDGVFILGYFPPKLGGVLDIPNDRWGRILVDFYHKTVRGLGYEDRVDFELEKRTLQATGKRFEHVRKVNSGQQWHLILAGRPRKNEFWGKVQWQLNHVRNTF